MLELGESHTTSSALHLNLDFHGDLQPWPNFSRAVQTMHESHTWRNKCLNLTLLGGDDPYTYGNVEVGDEHGVQGRFHKYFGDPLNAVFKSHQMGIRFGDFKSAKSTYSGIPDVIVRDNNPNHNHNVIVVGELKVPWVSDHTIGDKLDLEKALRKLLAQPIMYMQKLKCVYGFLSNYEETIFLRQLVDSQGVWRIEYSPVILASDTYSRVQINDPVVSVRQCLFYVACDASNQGPANNTTPLWVTD
jgi:hypothetical protein